MSSFVLIGYPVAHSVSPAMHNAAYRALGLPHQYEAVAAPDEAAVRGVFERIRAGEIAGANVTVPHKRLALELADRADPLAQQAGAANVLVRDRLGRVSAFNTDVLALVQEVGRLSPGASSAAIIGSGGAALAGVLACQKLGMSRVGVVARAWRAATPVAEWPRADEFRRLGATLVPWPERSYADRPEQQLVLGSAWDAWITTSDVIIQATSAGMIGAGPGEAVRDMVPWLEVRPTALAYDVVYNPPDTSFLQAARAAGLKVEGGLGMLVGQAVHAFELWLDRVPPRDVMRHAAEQALGLGSHAP
jgi:shikimate dehydrogenase